MIDENSRESFLELVRPPADYKLEYCIGTTFSLELPCLIQMALNSRGRKELVNELTVYQGLEIISDFATKAKVFTQNCRIKSLPPEIVNSGDSKKGRFISLLDTIVEEVPTLSVKSAFHPKVWLLRFDPVEGKSEPVFKLFTMSRNLTSALNWDISVCLIGQLGKTHDGNKEIIDFLKYLDRKSSLGKKKNQLIRKAIEDLQRVVFEAPSKQTFKNYEFQYKWGREKTWDQIDYTQYKKIVVVSPFLSAGQLEQLSRVKNVTLVTSSSDLVKLEGFEDLQKHTYILAVDNMELHAKMYFCQGPDGTDIYIGSANLTDSAWKGDNVEAQMRLLATKKSIDDFIRGFIFDESGRPYDWLRPFDAVYVSNNLEEQEKQKIEDKLDLAQGILSMGEFKLDYKAGCCDLSFIGDQSELPKGINGKLSLIGAQGKVNIRDVLVDGHSYGGIKSSEISAFISIELSYKGRKREFCTVAISNINHYKRNRAILNETIKDWESFWEYIGVVLDIEGETSIKTDKNDSSSSSRKDQHNITRNAVRWRYLEPLLLAGAKDASVIDKIDSALEALESKKDKVSLHVDFVKFRGFWKQYKEAYKEFQRYG